MAVEPYRAISWAPYEVLTETRMNQSENNLQWLHDNTPRALYTGPREEGASINRREGIRIASGRAVFSKRDSDRATTSVQFGSFFSEYCSPNITLGLLTNGQRKIFVVHSGLGNQLVPDHRGFDISVEVAAADEKNDAILKKFWVSWMAMGY